MRAIYFLLLAVVWLFPPPALGQGTNEVLLSQTENAYNPIPSPDGQLIAYVKTGWGRRFPASGLGRSNLRSEIGVMTLSGDVLDRSPLADAFLFGWTGSGRELICYRDGRFMLVGPHGGISRDATEDGGDEGHTLSERVAFLSKSNTFVWVEHDDSPPTAILTEHDRIAKSLAMMGNLVVPSPDERYLAVAGNGMDLWVYDTALRSWADLGKADIHPDKDWEYIKPSWNPWFPDGSRLAFFSGQRLIVASPDGRQKTTLLNSTQKAGLPVPSPDGRYVAYATFVPRLRKLRPDLTFWGGTEIWTVPADGTGGPKQITLPSEDTTYDLNWAGNTGLVFDRIADTPFYSHARLWAVAVAR
jgi:hypothetical protein